MAWWKNRLPFSGADQNSEGKPDYDRCDEEFTEKALGRKSFAASLQRSSYVQFTLFHTRKAIIRKFLHKRHRLPLYPGYCYTEMLPDANQDTKQVKPWPLNSPPRFGKNTLTKKESIGSFAVQLINGVSRMCPSFLSTLTGQGSGRHHRREPYIQIRSSIGTILPVRKGPIFRRSLSHSQSNFGQYNRCLSISEREKNTGHGSLGRTEHASHTCKNTIDSPDW